MYIYVYMYIYAQETSVCICCTETTKKQKKQSLFDEFYILLVLSYVCEWCNPQRLQFMYY